MDVRKTICQKKKNVHFVNESFFKKWTSEMAYVLGFFAADGCLTKNKKRKNYYIEFVSTDCEMINKVKRLLNSSHKISTKKQRSRNWKTAYRIQIGSKIIFHDLNNLGFRVNKSKTMKLPCIPSNFLPDFVRGYFDGDGCVSSGEYQPTTRKTTKKYFMIKFISGSKIFLQAFSFQLKNQAGISSGSLFKGINRGYRLSYSKKDSIKLFKYLYKHAYKGLYLKRKYAIFNRAFKKYGSVV